MISIDDAFSILNQTNIPLRVTKVALQNACDLVLAEPVFAPIALPPFRQANMDGYALCLHSTLVYDLVGEIKAGDDFNGELLPGEAVRIFTGAAVPDTAQAVIQQEKVTVKEKQLFLEDQVVPETNVRALGSQIQKGSLALPKGSRLNAAAIGFLAGLGLHDVHVYARPKVGVVVTGNELVAPGQLLAPGKVYESNGIMLQVALQAAHFQKINRYKVEDTFAGTKAVLQTAIQDNDLTLITGGISVGDYDFVGKALESLQVETLFYKVNQKPGKPLLAGKWNEKIVFALPGNPAASLTCFYVYVLPTLRRLSGAETNYTTTDHKKLAHHFEVNNTRAQFLKAKVTGNEVMILTHQDSSMLDSFAEANALVLVREGNYQIQEGVKVPVYLL